jgi:hypothetical protein
VHVSNLGFLDPMMFYKLRGFQRLQICNFWMDRTKDMNLSSEQILLHYWILDVLRIPTVYHLLFLDLGIKRYEFCKIGLKSDLKFLFESV